MEVGTPRGASRRGDHPVAQAIATLRALRASTLLLRDLAREQGDSTLVTQDEAQLAAIAARLASLNTRLADERTGRA